MLPIEDWPEERRRRFPVVMLALLLVNIAVFGYELSLSPAGLRAFIAGFGAAPAAIAYGGATPPTSALPVYGTVFTAMFIHGGLLHLAGNMVYLWVFGDNVESSFGHLTFLGFYFAAGVAAFLAQMMVDPRATAPAIGASGAIAGVLAAYLLLFPRAPVRVLFLVGPFFTLGRTAALPLIGLWFVLQLWQGVGSLGVASQNVGGIAYFAHIGGFLFGLTGTAVVLLLRHETVGRLIPAVWWDRSLRNAIIVVGLLLAALALAPLIAGPAAGLVRLGILAASALLALIDGLLRAGGRPGVLGEGQGFGRVLAIVQVLAALALIALLI